MQNAAKPSLILVSMSMSLLAPVHVRDANAGAIATPVVGGKAVKPGDWPDVVAVLTEDGSLCTGTLLGADLVLTAGHCIGGHPVEVIAGSVDLASSGGERRDVKWSKAYPGWETRYDVGVVMLEHPLFVKQRAIAEHCVSGKRDRLVAGTRLELVGFGLTTKTATDNNTRLNAAMLEVLNGTCEDDESCNSSIAPGGEFTAGGHGADACFGDSGGPVYIGTSHGPALIGVVSRGLASWGNPCGEGGVFVRADQVAAWVEEVTGRKLDRVECDLPADEAGGDDADEGTGGCSAGGAGTARGRSAAGGLSTSGSWASGLAIVYAMFCLVALKWTRLRRLASLRGFGSARRA